MVPLPALENATLPGLAFAYWMNSCAVRHGASARTVIEDGSSVKRAIGWKSPTVTLPMPISGTTSISGVIRIRR